MLLIYPCTMDRDDTQFYLEVDIVKHIVICGSLKRQASEYKNIKQGDPAELFGVEHTGNYNCALSVHFRYEQIRLFVLVRVIKTRHVKNIFNSTVINEEVGERGGLVEKGEMVMCTVK